MKTIQDRLRDGKQGPQADEKAMHEMFGVQYQKQTPKLSPRARHLLEIDCQTSESMMENREDIERATAFRLLLEWYDKCEAGL